MSIHIPFAKLPFWAQEALRAMSKRPSSVEVRAGSEHAVGGTFGSHSRTILWAWDGHQAHRFASSWGGSNPWAQGAEAAVNAGFSTRLQAPHQAVLEYSSFGNSATLYVHPDSPLLRENQSALPAGPPAMPRAQRVVLLAAAHYIPRARRQNAEEVGIGATEYDAAKAVLQSIGALNKAGAITAEGRTLLEQLGLGGLGAWSKLGCR